MDKKGLKLGKKIAELRKYKEIRQVDLANLIGIHRTRMCNIEKSVLYPTLDELEKIADILEVSVDFLLDRQTKEISVQELQVAKLFLEKMMEAGMTTEDITPGFLEKMAKLAHALYKL